VIVTILCFCGLFICLGVWVITLISGSAARQRCELDEPSDDEEAA
jgi:hypothetical protein